MDTSSFPPPPYFDTNELRVVLTGIFNEHGDAAEARPAVVERLKTLVKVARGTARLQLEADGNGRRCAKGLAGFQDELVRLIYDYTVSHVYRATNPSDAERMAVIATGGYGRELLAPGSDIDLLFCCRTSRRRGVRASQSTCSMCSGTSASRSATPHAR